MVKVLNAVLEGEVAVAAVESSTTAAPPNTGARGYNEYLVQSLIEVWELVCHHCKAEKGKGKGRVDRLAA